MLLNFRSSEVEFSSYYRIIATSSVIIKIIYSDYNRRNPLRIADDPLSNALEVNAVLESRRKNAVSLKVESARTHISSSSAALEPRFITTPSVIIKIIYSDFKPRNPLRIADYQSKGVSSVDSI
ncbi:hypothetical protein QE152_g27262 [Popillia japonica]|uniref:Uncharacterized protein n=1 Tax=Popillia japonica TaxID=7064 RepID=A0AAW1JTK1_POPJA